MSALTDMTESGKRKAKDLEDHLDYSGHHAREKKLPRWEESPSRPLQRQRLHRGIRANDDGDGKKDYWEYSNSPPSDRWFNSAQEFSPPSDELDYYTIAERKERRRVSRIDFASRNSDYILRLCEKARGGFYQCRVDDDERILVGCRNYIVTLSFDDGTKWLLKTGQPNYKWSSFYTCPEFLIREIATNLWVYENTGVPVPRIRLWDTRTSRQNKFGQPWYVMHKVEGETLHRQLKVAGGADSTLDVDQKEVELQQNMARFSLEFLKYPSIEGTYRLKGRAKYFHGSEDRPLNMVRLRKLPRVTGPPQGMLFDLLGALSHCRVLLEMDSKYWDPASNEEALHIDVLSYLEKSIPKIVDPRFDKVYFLAHGDITDCNILCDRDFQVTGIIDWELAKTIPLQDAVLQPSTENNQLLRMVPSFLSGAAGDYKKAVRAWREYDKGKKKIRDGYVATIDRLDDSVMGDETTIWTAGYKYVTGLYRIAHAFHMICYFVNDYGDLLEEEQFVRMFVLSEIKKITEEAVGLVENDRILMGAGP